MGPLEQRLWTQKYSGVFCCDQFMVVFTEMTRKAHKWMSTYSTPFTDGWTAMTILPQLVIALNAKTHAIKESVKFRKGLDITNVPVFVFVPKRKCCISFHWAWAWPKSDFLKTLQLIFQATKPNIWWIKMQILWNAVTANSINSADSVSKNIWDGGPPGWFPTVTWTGSRPYNCRDTGFYPFRFHFSQFISSILYPQVQSQLCKRKSEEILQHVQ